MSSKFLVSQSSVGISSRSVGFLGYFFFQFCVKSINYPSLVINNFWIVLFVISGGFPIKFMRCSFHLQCLPFWLGVLILITSFTANHAIPDCLSSTKLPVFWIWPWKYFNCSFWYLFSIFFLHGMCFRCLLMSIKFVSHCYRIFIDYNSVGKSRPVIPCGSNGLFSFFSVESGVFFRRGFYDRKILFQNDEYASQLFRALFKPFLFISIKYNNWLFI